MQRRQLEKNGHYEFKSQLLTKRVRRATNINSKFDSNSNVANVWNMTSEGENIFSSWNFNLQWHTVVICIIITLFEHIIFKRINIIHKFMLSIDYNTPT